MNPGNLSDLIFEQFVSYTRHYFAKGRMSIGAPPIVVNSCLPEGFYEITSEPGIF
jgi:hypothetical protein